MQVEPLQHPVAQYPQQGMLPPHPAGYLFPLMSQIEFYFSPQNLAKDKYMMTQLNATDHLGAVAMEVICSFPKVKLLHAQLRNIGHLPPHMIPMADPFVVRMALEYSAVVGTSQDGNWVVLKQPRSTLPGPPEASPATPTNVEASKPAASTPSSPSSQTTGSSSLGVPTHPLPPSASITPEPANTTHERSTIVLRDVPPDVPVEDILAVFTTEAGKPTGARPDAGNMWLLSFETEQQAVLALDSTRERTIGGVLVQARLKSDAQSPPVQAAPSTLDGASVGGNSNTSNSASATPNVTPTHPYALAPHPVYHMPMHQQPQYPPQVMGYGFYPHPNYGVPMGGIPQQHPMAMRVQQQFFNQGYTNRGYSHYKMPQRSGFSSNGKPPPHVYVKPEHNTSVQQHNGGKGNNTNTNGYSNWNKNNKKKNYQRNRQQQQNQQQGHGPNDQASRDSVPQDQASQQRKNEGNNGGKRNKQNRFQQQQQQSKQGKKKPPPPAAKIDLGTEHFPALGEGKVPSITTGAKQSSVQTNSGYAQALLKDRNKPAKTQPSTTTVPGNSEEQLALEGAMDRLAIAGDTGAESNDAW